MLWLCNANFASPLHTSLVERDNTDELDLVDLLALRDLNWLDRLDDPGPVVGWLNSADLTAVIGDWLDSNYGRDFAPVYRDSVLVDRGAEVLNVNFGTEDEAVSYDVVAYSFDVTQLDRLGPGDKAVLVAGRLVTTGEALPLLWIENRSIASPSPTAGPHAPTTVAGPVRGPSATSRRDYM